MEEARQHTVVSRMYAITKALRLDRCPHCSVAHPSINLASEPCVTSRDDGGATSVWAVYGCRSCGSLVTVKGLPGEHGEDTPIEGIYPSKKVANDCLPAAARRFLNQAFEVRSSPDAAAVMAGSAVDAMLRASGLPGKDLHARIESALTKNIITKYMADWAHRVRLNSNASRHADEEDLPISIEEADQSILFAEALGEFLFTLKLAAERGIALSEARKNRQAEA